MTEAQWNTCTEPEQMLKWLRLTGKETERKGVLLQCARVRQIWWELLSNGRSKRAVSVAETFADGRASEEERDQAFNEALDAHAACSDVLSGSGDETSWLARVAAYKAQFLFGWCSLSDREHAAYLGLLQDVYGNPFRPVALDSSVMTAALVTLAQAAYEERDLPSGHLYPARLAVLADALEESGVTDASLLGHLRGPGPHVRGCWALDTVLGKS